MVALKINVLIFSEPSCSYSAYSIKDTLLPSTISYIGSWITDHTITVISRLPDRSKLWRTALLSALLAFYDRVMPADRNICCVLNLIILFNFLQLVNDIPPLTCLRHVSYVLWSMPLFCLLCSALPYLSDSAIISFLRFTEAFSSFKEMRYFRYHQNPHQLPKKSPQILNVAPKSLGHIPAQRTKYAKVFDRHYRIKLEHRCFEWSAWNVSTYYWINKVLHQ